HVLRELLLEDGEESARGRDAVGALPDEFFRRLEKRRPQPPPLLVYHHARARAGHDLVEHGERPGQRVPRVARRTRPLGIEHEYADTRAVDRLAAPSSSDRHPSLQTEGRTGAYPGGMHSAGAWHYLTARISETFSRTCARALPGTRLARPS